MSFLTFIQSMHLTQYFQSLLVDNFLRNSLLATINNLPYNNIKAALYVSILSFNLYTITGSFISKLEWRASPTCA